jgi:hypothetical protein
LALINNVNFFIFVAGYSFAGRKPMQPPGGYSSISFGNDVTPGTSYNYKSSYNVHAPMSASHQGFSPSTYQVRLKVMIVFLYLNPSASTQQQHLRPGFEHDSKT